MYVGSMRGVAIVVVVASLVGRVAADVTIAEERAGHGTEATAARAGKAAAEAKRVEARAAHEKGKAAFEATLAAAREASEAMRATEAAARAASQHVATAKQKADEAKQAAQAAAAAAQRRDCPAAKTAAARARAAFEAADEAYRALYALGEEASSREREAGLAVDKTIAEAAPTRPAAVAAYAAYKEADIASQISSRAVERADKRSGEARRTGDPAKIKAAEVDEKGAEVATEGANIATSDALTQAELAKRAFSESGRLIREARASHRAATAARASAFPRSAREAITATNAAEREAVAAARSADVACQECTCRCDDMDRLRRGQFTGDRAAVDCAGRCLETEKTNPVCPTSCECSCDDIDRYNRGTFTGDAAAVACVRRCADAERREDREKQCPKSKRIASVDPKSLPWLAMFTLGGLFDLRYEPHQALLGFVLGYAVTPNGRGYVLFMPEVKTNGTLSTVMIPFGFQYDFALPIKRLPGLFAYPRLVLGYGLSIVPRSFGGETRIETQHLGIMTVMGGIKYVFRDRWIFAFEPIGLMTFFSSNGVTLGWRLDASVGLRF